jgi:hypothetical protein
MSWSEYEPMSDLSVGSAQLPQMQMQSMSMQPPMQMQKQQQQQPHKIQPQQQQLQQQPHQLGAPQKQYKHDNSVPVPGSATQTKSKWEDISDYHDVTDWLYLLVAAIAIEILVIAITRFFPGFSGKWLNLWYSRFKLNAIIADVFSVLIGFGIARYVYTEFIYPNYDWNPLYFTGTAVGVQIIHDLLFYYGVIRQVPEGKNGIMDIFKPYAEAGGAKLVAGDSAIMVGTSLAAMLLKSASPHLVVAVGLVSMYILPYIVETKNDFSSLS